MKFKHFLRTAIAPKTLVDCMRLVNAGVSVHVASIPNDTAMMVIDRLKKSGKYEMSNYHPDVFEFHSKEKSVQLIHHDGNWTFEVYAGADYD